MIKYMILLIAPFLATSVIAAHDIKFYSVHPVQLQEALEKCPDEHPSGVSCEELDLCAQRANKLVAELHRSPQGFGKKILALQEGLALLAKEVKSKPHQPGLRISLEENKMQLNERLAIVKWLESPRG